MSKQPQIQDDVTVVYAKLSHNIDKPADSLQMSQHHTPNTDQPNNDDNIAYTKSENLLTLDSLSIKLHSISPLWYQFGLAVGISQNVLNSYTDLPPKKCLENVLNYWLTNHHSKPTWQDVMQALNEMKHFR